MLEIRGITRVFGNVPVLRGIDLTVERGEIVCLLGPSGCGKTTLLRIIAGLEQADGGDILLDGESIMRVPVHERDFGLMFQDYALFPHMNVAENILFGLRMHGVPKTQRQQRLREVLQLVGLEGFEHRDVTELSGGERQRVALARSLAPNPRLLMLDEPLGSLDATLRDQLVGELRAIINHAGLTAIYVTHDQSEAFAIADRVAIMNDGIIEQVGTPEVLYRQPRTAFIARFLGLNNVVPVTRREGHHVQTPVGTFTVSGTAAALLLHPDGLYLAAPDDANTITGRVQARIFQGNDYRLTLQAGGPDDGVTLTFRLPGQADHVPAVGDTIAVSVTPEMVVPLTESDQASRK